MLPPSRTISRPAAACEVAGASSATASRRKTATSEAGLTCLARAEFACLADGTPTWPSVSLHLRRPSRPGAVPFWFAARRAPGARPLVSLDESPFGSFILPICRASVDPGQGSEPPGDTLQLPRLGGPPQP